MDAGSDLLVAPIATVSRLLHHGELSPEDLLEAVLARQEVLEPELNAFTTVLADLARRQAREAAAAIAAGQGGPLAGIPVSVKDNFDIAGVPTLAGSRVLRGTEAAVDSAVHSRLRDAGAVVFGKTNMLEFAYGFVHPDHGQCNNPWDTGRTAGGSSSGSASAVAAGIGYASVGTDTGGSVRAPASFCGLVGMKPTCDSIDRRGLVPLSATLDHVGLLTRTVADNRLLLAVLTGRPVPAGPPPLCPVVGVITELLDATPDAQVRDAFAKAVEVLGSTGARIREVSLPGITELWRRGVEILGPEAAHAHRHWLPGREADYAPPTFANLMAGRAVPAVVYLDALEARQEFGRRVDSVLGEADVLAAPTMPGGATVQDPVLDLAGLDACVRTIPFNVSGHPALCLPAGSTLDGLPLGWQLIGPKGREDAVYAIAERYETACGGFPTPSLDIAGRA
ncbi:amidase [Amycolatopsis methanolica]|uniref:Amidase n=1 Tax=Amycolatopsis methanolica 239 TaxID=1068978 RepID=A0A076MWU9_AMYME|nr:amidase [Amycolatopsis methanolica]AIJ23215.1 amidase [Amycolatopsis methanolica 239]